MSPDHENRYLPPAQQGAALMVMLVIMVMGTATFLITSLSTSALRLARERDNSEVLAQARDALIGYAATVVLTSGTRRPGDLPCPDTNNDGIAETSCGNASGTTGQTLRIRRLPWKTLGLPDLRDSSGERLWYAVSNNFKNSTRTVCTDPPGLTGCLNSDTNGTITLRSSDGVVTSNGSSTSGVVAAIIAPGAVLTREGSASVQDRSAAGINTATNYLDIATVNGITEDNANFTDSSSTNGFIQGPVKNADGFVILNDQILAITVDSLMPALEKRVVAEVKLCLKEYAAKAQNVGRYPWASRVRPTSSPSYNDRSGYLFGRLPDTTFDTTDSDSGSVMDDTWTGLCTINSGSGWWLNWKEQVFYGLADAYKPVLFPAVPAADVCATPGNCLTVNPPSATGDKKFVVIVAGRKLPGQSRSYNSDFDRGTLSNYLEVPNPIPIYTGTAPNPTSFSRATRSATFNDTVVFE